MAVVDVFAAVQHAVAGAQTEIVLFVLAIFAHKVVFGHYAIPGRTSKVGVNNKATLAKKGSGGKAKLLATTKEAVPKDAENFAREAARIKAEAKNNFDAALKLFQSLPTKSTIHYNILMDAVVARNDRAAARRLLTDAVADGLADTATFNLFVKCLARAGDITGARQAVSEMKAAGLRPNCITFNELLESAAPKSFESAWCIVKEMKAAGIKPNHVTCSVLLKGVQVNTNTSHMDQILAMTQDMDEKADEVLFSSVIEACIRLGRLDLLQSAISRQRSTQHVQIQSCHAYGSLIRAYGVLKDINGVWATWQELKTRRIELTSVTFGCMVEAVTTNMSPDDGHELIREALEDPKTKPLVNSVVYGSVLKGFSHTRRFDRVWAIHAELKQEGIPLTITTYNTLVDACARSAEVAHISDLMKDMAADKIDPNLITYCAIVKCYCQANRVDSALEVLEHMRRDSALQPDEHTYNTVINGCARQGLYDKGMAIFEEMCKAGVKPSNYTLSVLVKLACRARRLDNAFKLCERLSQTYGVRPNVHVYNNLIQGCISHHKGLQSAFKVVDDMTKHKVQLDARTYLLLLNACVDVSSAHDAAGLIRAAVGLEGLHPHFEQVPRRLLMPQGGLPLELLRDTIESMATRCNEAALAKQLVQDLGRLPSCKLDPKWTARFLQK